MRYYNSFLMDTILQIFYSSKNIRRDRYLKQIHALQFLITIKERSKRRASPKISQKVVVSFNFAEKSKHVYSFLFFLSTIASVLLGLTPPPFDFSSSLPESAGRRKNSKKGGRRARGREREKRWREREIEEHVQGSTEEKFLCVVAHYRIEYRPHAAISAHRVTSSREIGMRKRKYRCLSRCGRRCPGEPNLPQRRF